ncbi:TPA: hypothetical protein ACXDAY_002185 [Clostridium botulinum]|uniref:hypothetical protein n=1 Tax=Clostridium botulinum TaxID=1491 RepID=UPI0004674714|nr:hypothetical protein [Clostridium botulinum]APH20964.1 hypothetical protein NPD1_4184 [Clostridium botulinum]APQ71228.1 hypothetical protein RSJ8_4141 [Clostridium botulinum]APR02435.1 hypothetical protein RSJ2_4004 [Clostridium botulinum]AUN01532.1 hypothetical protein RSJ19_00690 [Clostridium botulinum]MBN3352112.1 hypothetical protein [Clostridium botulinum]
MNEMDKEDLKEFITIVNNGIQRLNLDKRDVISIINNLYNYNNKVKILEQINSYVEGDKTKICDICNTKITEKEFKNNDGYCHKCFAEMHKR